MEFWTAVQYGVLGIPPLTHACMSRRHGLAGLLGLNARLPVASSSLMEALALHLDVADHSRSSAQQAWSVLAQMLNTAAKLVVDLEVKSCLCRCRMHFEFTAGFEEDLDAQPVFAISCRNV